MWIDVIDTSILTLLLQVKTNHMSMCNRGPEKYIL